MRLFSAVSLGGMNHLSDKQKPKVQGQKLPSGEMIFGSGDQFHIEVTWSSQQGAMK